MSEFKYTLLKFRRSENCEADSLPDIGDDSWCGKLTQYYVVGAHFNIALCKDHREQLRKMGLLK